MALHERSIRLTYDDYLLFPEDGRRHEILDGEHYVTAAPFVRHQILSFRLTLLLGSFAEARKLGQVLAAPLDVILSPHDIVQPDLIFLSRERLHLLTERNLQGAPDLVIEILSESTRQTDRETKAEIYDRAGVREYWVVDPNQNTVMVYLRIEGRLMAIARQQAHTKDVLMTSLLPGLDIHLADLFK
ncbi:MAG TPA: Uma2 family endonuclease [Thermoanaerobaculia bacterium]|nr:Uma2 family endonuclease [Thermoanaerobaculia bacterium]